MDEYNFFDDLNLRRFYIGAAFFIVGIFIVIFIESKISTNFNINTSQKENLIKPTPLLITDPTVNH